ncbi:hypothetical protein BKA69DRAFT_1163877 [Paraphysoderma sedebokerense]|nr:hypothetical protein BKA69DRAFT_1163877 [Paraphysoderma sedebokerense]
MALKVSGVCLFICILIFTALFYVSFNRKLSKQLREAISQWQGAPSYINSILYNLESYDGGEDEVDSDTKEGLSYIKTIESNMATVEEPMVLYRIGLPIEENYKPYFWTSTSRSMDGCLAAKPIERNQGRIFSKLNVQKGVKYLDIHKIEADPSYEKEEEVLLGRNLLFDRLPSKVEYIVVDGQKVKYKKYKVTAKPL